MLTPKEISLLFEVQINTLYNWRKSKPKLFAYLQNADYNSKINNEINALLDYFSNTIEKDFTLKEIDFLITSDFELNSIEEVNEFQDYFIKANYKMLPTKHKFVLEIYNKIKELNIVEKYLLYKKVFKIRKFGDKNRAEFFKEFLKKEKNNG
ncbi:hypothetical protein CRV08_01715 [Halarcobacter ebronensis]|uniref:Uncharacterized protein n=1 Tax=Halarcobacter ebronensis TaxID=1462615 RepID=A0A4Q1ALS3_9BACT|nr:hypothetical protein [Halarcobacter ebronensis]QKF81950.1 hypothetical protein AEBR_1463 [Halarcobacter ebronensis]RXJ70306.1 hypothetical protein CRV08_01715 [Halarcobacter ebronensis]RXK04331.1 hypothetical protein CRV07_11220 [Halarcobacter ebronensis]